MSTSGKWILGIGLILIGLSILFVGFAFMTVTTALTSLSTDDSYEESTGSGSDRVAIIEIDQPIMSSEETVKALRKYQHRSNVKAIVLRLNSPGGAVAPSQEIFSEVRRTVETGKPVVLKEFLGR